MDIEEAGEKFIETVIPMNDGCRQVHVPRHRNGMYSDVSSTKCPALVSYWNNDDSFCNSKNYEESFAMESLY